MTFTPKFVDLVRNLTSVQGTGPVTLGSIVSGYSGIAQSLSAGEQFYYCIQSVDKPQEREVGRGTLQSDGKVARQPVSGGLTNFSSGTKTIAVVAAAEWFAKLEQGATGAPALDVASRSALAAKPTTGTPVALVTEPGREGLFVWNPANLAIQVSADTRQGIYVPPASDPDGSSGAWVRKFDGSVNVRWFGATGDGVTDDSAAFAGALAFLLADAQHGFGYTYGARELFVPKGTYFLGTTPLDLVCQVRVRGEGGLPFGGGASVLKWAAGSSGIRVQRYNTSGAATVDGTTHAGGDASIIEGLWLHGGYAGTEGEFHGIHAKARVKVRECNIDNFQGDGIHIDCSSTGSPEGNANGFVIEDVLLKDCRTGLFIQGADANSGRTTGVKAYANRRWGIFENSFIGNAHYSPETGDNGWGTAVTPTIVSHGGNWYSVIHGQEAGAATNAPSGTSASNAWWRYVQPGAVDTANSIPAWASGIVVRSGGSYYSGGGSNVFVNPYAEGGQGAMQFNAPTMVWNGAGTGQPGYAGDMRVGDGGMTFGGKAKVAGDFEVAGAATFTSLANAAGGIIVGAAGMGVAGPLNLNCNSNNIGPQGGGVLDSTLALHNTNLFGTVEFRSHLGGADSLDGSLTSARGDGFYLSGYPKLYLRSASTIIGTVDATGFGLAASKVLKVGGTQVVGAQGVAVADATDNASAITQLNSLLGRLRAHGLIAA